MTEASGLGFAGYCHGIVVGDIDNDGDQDVFLCNYGPNVLFLNNGNGTFKDITKDAGVGGFNWSTGGAFLDYDNDGDLDLYVTNYGQWKLPDDDRFCTGNRDRHRPSEAKVRTYCSPKSIKPARHFLYRNNGDRTFTDVTEAAGVGRTDGRGFGVVAADLNRRRPDRSLRRQRHVPELRLSQSGRRHLRGRHRDLGRRLRRAWPDPRRDGSRCRRRRRRRPARPARHESLAANPTLSIETSAAGMFEDQTPTSGMATDSMPWVGWGCALADFDNDGWPDCFVANGHVDNNLDLLGSEKSLRSTSLAAPQPGRKSISAWRPATPVPTSIPTTSAGEPRSAISTTTATSISWSITRMVPRLSCATTRKPPITGFACPWSAP